jgi:hypothetical protein
LAAKSAHRRLDEDFIAHRRIVFVRFENEAGLVVGEHRPLEIVCREAVRRTLDRIA